MRLSATNPKIKKQRIESINGSGNFALETICKDEILVVWGGIILSAAELANLPQERCSYVLQVEEGYYQYSFVEDEIGDYFNHSCNPNAGLSGPITLVAMREIKAGEQICFDYAMSDGDPFDEFTCCCGSDLCRHRVSGNDWMNPELQRRYSGYFSPYLQRRINKLNQT